MFRGENVLPTFNRATKSATSRRFRVEISVAMVSSFWLYWGPVEYFLQGVLAITEHCLQVHLVNKSDDSMPRKGRYPRSSGPAMRVHSKYLTAATLTAWAIQGLNIAKLVMACFFLYRTIPHVRKKR